jgi:hypothetical protein
MKILRLLILVIFSLTLLSSSCKKHVIQPANQLSLLPPATQTGARTFGCLINGQAFVPHNRSLLEGPMMQCNYVYTAGGYFFTVGGGNKNSDGSISDIILETDSLAVSEGQTIKLTDHYINGKAFGDYQIINAPSYSYYYYTNQILTGQLTITKLDLAKQIASGTFYFNVLSNSGDTVKVTNGRFDMPY